MRVVCAAGTLDNPETEKRETDFNALESSEDVIR
jgi:hypothetical protein